MYIKSMDAVWKLLDVKVKLLSSALLYQEDEDEGDMVAGGLRLLT